jgi:hypothetical protein
MADSRSEGHGAWFGVEELTSFSDSKRTMGRPGVHCWMITRDAPSVATGVVADRDQAANDAAAALSELPRWPRDVGHPEEEVAALTGRQRIASRGDDLLDRSAP